jgi:hypothetical protein
VADIERLPEWATEFARELRRDDDVIETPPDQGRDGGVPDPRRRTPRRAHALHVHDVQAPDMPDELLDAQHASQLREFANIEPGLGGSTGAVELERHRGRDRRPRRR